MARARSESWYIESSCTLECTVLMGISSSDMTETIRTSYTTRRRFRYRGIDLELGLVTACSLLAGKKATTWQDVGQGAQCTLNLADGAGILGDKVAIHVQVLWGEREGLLRGMRHVLVEIHDANGMQVKKRTKILLLSSLSSLAIHSLTLTSGPRQQLLPRICVAS
jgi:hypothetical protein